MIGDDGKQLNPDLYDFIGRECLGLRRGVTKAGDLVSTQHQPTKSSRSGTLEAYTTFRRLQVITACRKCGRLRTELGGPHAVQLGPDGRFDCTGDRVDGGVA